MGRGAAAAGRVLSGAAKFGKGISEVTSIITVCKARICSLVHELAVLVDVKVF